MICVHQKRERLFLPEHVHTENISYVLESLVDFPALAPTMPVQGVWKNAEKKSTTCPKNVVDSASYTLSEAEFPYLDCKPKNDRKSGKGRWHAGEALLSKRLAGQAFLFKQVVESAQKLCGKKRRARLLTENNDDMLQLNVPYSMNRKNRWELESAADCLRNRRSDGQVKLSAVDQQFSVRGYNPKQDVLAYHEVDNKGVVSSRVSQKQRGSALETLNLSTESEDPNEKSIGIRYVMAKPHPIIKCAMGNMFEKVKPLARSTRRAQLDVSVYSTDDGETNENDDDLTGNLAQTIADETARIYCPRQTKYTLADFIMDKNVSVIVRPKRCGRVATDEFVQVDMPQVDANSSAVGSVDETMFTDIIDKASSPKLKKFTVSAGLLGLNSREDWLQQCELLEKREELRFQWLNKSHVVFQIDLTPILLSNQPSTPLLVLTIAYKVNESKVEVVLNNANGCVLETPLLTMISSSHREYFNDTVSGVEGLMRLILKNTRVQTSDNERIDMTNTMHSNKYNSTQLAACALPYTDYDLIDGKLSASTDTKTPQQASNKPANKNANAISNVNDEDEDEDDGFEHVYFEDIDAATDDETQWLDATLDEQMIAIKTLCDECGETNLTEILHGNQCIHSLCRQCLRDHLQSHSVDVNNLVCSINGCKSTIPAYLLQTVLHMSQFQRVLHKQAAQVIKARGQQMFTCPNGCGVAAIEPNNLRYSHVHCQKCQLHWCSNCGSQPNQQLPPHWPMNCTQAKKWMKKCKFEHNYQLLYPTLTTNAINEQFWSICRDARERRTNYRFLAKHAQKPVTWKIERQFNPLRTSCLQIVENSFAWLYLVKNGAERPSNWNQAKSVLNTLLAGYNMLEHHMMRQSSEGRRAEDDVQKVRGLLHKTLQELTFSTANVRKNA